MQMRIYNLERGIWADWYCTTLFFFAFGTFTFCFSFGTYMFVEAPLANLFNDFLRSKEPKSSTVFYRSQSAKAHQHDKSEKKERLIGQGDGRYQINTSSSDIVDEPEDLE
jgi:hypothetical protein